MEHPTIARHPVLSALTALALLLGASLSAASAEFTGNPVVFVHGGFGSAAQFQSQALRFSSNGYPDSHLAALEYDSLFGEQSFDEVLASLDELIAGLQAATGAAQVDLMGHSLGTRVSQSYLESPERAASVAHYVNIDGGEADALPGGVPTLAIWAGEGSPGRRIVGATNVTLPNQTHVESATSREAFAAMYRFLTGKRPATLDVVRTPGPIELSGRALRFPQNVAVEGATLAMWELNPFSGERRGEPKETATIGADGSFGPFRAFSGRSYEFTLRREGTEREHRIYFEPFLRSDRFVRLLTDDPGGGIDSLIERSDRHVAATIVRYKELWGDQGAENDVLRINGVNVINAATSPQANRTIGLFVFDAGSDGVTDLSGPIESVFGLPFLSGADLFVPAQIPTRGTVTVKLVPRGAAHLARVIRFPAAASTVAAISVQLNDFERPLIGRGASPAQLPTHR
jgi:pimeloyl-ACP methyl ester carboxylesterase